MKYFEIRLNITPADPWKEIFTSMMGEIGCDSFMDDEDEGTLLCYIPVQDYNEAALKEVVEDHGFENVEVTYSIREMPDIDWNAEWEANYQPVMIADRCYIRAPFHPARPETEFEIIIEPKMSFGTAHHATTAQMAEYVLETEMKNKYVLDMGSGTGVLAILSKMRGATDVTAIDNDEWAYRNGLENVAHNNCADIQVLLGDASLLGEKKYDVILANINRNILLQDIPTYVRCLQPNGLLFMSGFYEEPDLDIIRKCCEENGLKYIDHKMRDNWVAAKFQKLG
ncbi:MAG: 50S ribosomal protein L11 methyltransferase [Bacteroidales bacterium]|nr:50S ribosomal protein L11 methyltransferase [Bacteroidales bacterium]